MELPDFEVIRIGKTNDMLFFESHYDSCLQPAYLLDNNVQVKDFFERIEEIDEYCDGELSCIQAGTNWSFIWYFNMLIMFAQSANFIILATGAFYFYPRMIGTYCNFLLGSCHALALIVSFYLYKTPWSRWCGYNLAPNMQFEGGAGKVMEFGKREFLGDSTYVNDYVMIRMLLISQLIVLIVQCACCCLPFFTLPCYGYNSAEPGAKKRNGLHSNRIVIVNEAQAPNQSQTNEEADAAGQSRAQGNNTCALACDSDVS